jgi:hypothetical protein
MGALLKIWFANELRVSAFGEPPASHFAPGFAGGDCGFLQRRSAGFCAAC